ncbi:transcriptional regulator with XRE-family HTH domain [Kitasatospora sp. MAP12-15]|uniref:helix-turn-helix domain-containing protein n=1 Tax=unclassified Kitasatospora TaxID=2633591 RepID=UPI0024763E6E|nr:helix-turn-helix transcriptional regulator [Kitasatospora sp. MAP12-44]MDH6110909.1 transcriptional regulator with XRE-family HTH domain [Kitasatospora sp. MAP12-44]
MPPRSMPTLRQRRLGAELRKMREHAGMTGHALAKHLGIEATQVSQMESGRIGVSADRLRSLAAACRCLNQPLIDALVEIVQDRTKGWWEEYRGIIPTGIIEVAEMEYFSTSIRTAVTSYIPGLLQSAEYSSAVFTRLVPALPKHESDARTAFRAQRRDLLTEAAGKPYEAFIHEAALRMRFGGRSGLRNQLASLLEDSEIPGVTIRVIPFAVDTFPGSGETMMLASGQVPGLDTVQIDVHHAPIFIDAEAELLAYRAIFSTTENVALAPQDSRKFILGMIEEI